MERAITPEGVTVEKPSVKASLTTVRSSMDSCVVQAQGVPEPSNKASMEMGDGVEWRDLAVEKPSLITAGAFEKPSLISAGTLEKPSLISAGTFEKPMLLSGLTDRSMGSGIVLQTQMTPEPGSRSFGTKSSHLSHLDERTRSSLEGGTGPMDHHPSDASRQNSGNSTNRSGRSLSDDSNGSLLTLTLPRERLQVQGAQQPDVPVSSGGRFTGSGSSLRMPTVIEYSKRETENDQSMASTSASVMQIIKSFSVSRFSKSSNKCLRCWKALRSLSVRRWRCLRLVAVTSPWAIFSLLCFGLGRHLITIIAAGFSAVVVLWFACNSAAPVIPEEFSNEILVDELSDFGDYAYAATIRDYRRLVQMATPEQRFSLCIFLELSRSWSRTGPSIRTDQSIRKSGESTDITTTDFFRPESEARSDSRDDATSWRSIPRFVTHEVFYFCSSIASSLLGTHPRGRRNQSTASSRSPRRRASDTFTTSTSLKSTATGRNASRESVASMESRKEVTFNRDADVRMYTSSKYSSSEEVSNPGGYFSPTTVRTSHKESVVSDVSATSYADFNRRCSPSPNVSYEQIERPSGLSQQNSCGEIISQFSLDFDLPLFDTDTSTAEIHERGSSGWSGKKSWMSGFSKGSWQSRSKTDQHIVPDATASESGMSGAASYHSVSEAVINDGSTSGEVVSAEIAGLGRGPTGMPRVRIEFQSQCLRTQNVWQRSLLAQQRSLLNAISTQLKKTQDELRDVKSWAEDMREDQKVLLRGFRKIVARELDNIDEMDEVKERVVVVVIDEDAEVRASAVKVCQELEYQCFTFKCVNEGAKLVMRLTQDCAQQRPSKDLTVGRSSIISLGEEDPPKKSWGEEEANGQEKISGGEKTSGGPTMYRRVSSRSILSLGAPVHLANWNMLPLVLLGASLLNQMPPAMESEQVCVALTSRTEDFEDVGRSLLASGEAEVRERLRSKGITEYLFHPLSMSAVRGAIAEMLKTQLGDEYLLVDTLGRGAFGVVYRARRLRDGEVFALKEISRRRLMRATSEQTIKMEPNTLKSLCWPTVVNLLDEWTSSKNQVQYLLLPIMLGGTVSHQIETAAKNYATIPSDHSSAWYAQTVHALSYLHWKGVLHRDIKPANLFLGADMSSLRVGDLGSAARLPGPGPHPNRRIRIPGVITTITHSSPEVFVDKVFYSGSDLWSLGVSFFQVFALRLPHDLPEGMTQDSFNIVDPKTLGTGGKDVLTELRSHGLVEEVMASELIQCLVHDHLARPTAAALAAEPHTRARLEQVLVFKNEGASVDHFLVLDRSLKEGKKAEENSDKLAIEVL